MIPVLKELNPSVEKAATRMAANLRVDSFYLEKQAADFLKEKVIDSGELSLVGFTELYNSIKVRVVKDYVNSVTKCNFLESVHINAMLNIAEKGGRTNLPCGYTAESKNGFLSVYKGEKAAVKTEFKVEISEIDAKKLENNQNVNSLLLKNVLDCDRIVGKLVLRTRMSGDSIRLKNRGCTKTLKKLYTENHIPDALRDIWPVIADDNGVVWIYGIGVAHRVAVTENSVRAYKINVQEV